MKFFPFLLLLVISACNSPSKNTDPKTSPPEPVKPGNLEFFEVYNLSEISSKEFQTGRFENLVSFPIDSTYCFVAQKDLQKVDSILSIPEIKQELPKDLEFIWSYGPETNKYGVKGKYLYAVKIPKGKIARIDGRYIKQANIEFEGKHKTPYINLTMSPDGTIEWEKMTTDNLNLCIAMTIDHKVLVCPRVTCPIQSGSAGIKMNSLKDAEELTARINRGRR